MSALAALARQYALPGATGPAARRFALAGWAARSIALRRNAAIKHKSTRQSATGIHSSNLVQTSRGMSATSFSTREYFHGRALVALQPVKLALLLLCLALPAARALSCVLRAACCVLRAAC